MNQPTSPVELTEQQFFDQFGPVEPEEGMLEFEDVQATAPEHVWTIVEGDEEHLGPDGEYRPNLYALPGFHVVNRIGYLTTQTPWTDAGLTVLYFDAQE